MNQDTIFRLEETARAAALNAYAPYSRFRVGAAILTATARIYGGANIENASFGLTICAERVALATAFSAGDTKIIAACVACIDATPVTELHQKVPCGACRQWIQELAPDCEIIIAGEQRIFRCSELLPIPFTL